MKIGYSLLLVSFLFYIHGNAQQIVYSEISKKDTRNIQFNIIGKLGDRILVYKNIGRTHLIDQYNVDMQWVESVPLDFIPDKVLEVECIAYADFFLLIYQYQKNNVVYCSAAKMNVTGSLLAGPVVLDTTAIGFFASNRIYATSYSENKQKILVYKRSIKNDVLNQATKLFNTLLIALDSTRQVFSFNNRKEQYSDIRVANSGSFVYAKTIKKQARDLAGNLEVVTHEIGEDSLQTYSLATQSQWVDDVLIKIDNLHNNYIVSGFCFNDRRGNINGIYSAVVHPQDTLPIRQAFNPFPDSLRNTVLGSASFSNAFNDLLGKEMLLKKNGGFVMVGESINTQTIVNNNAWNRNYYNDMAYSNLNNYYLYNPGYFGYRPWNDYGRQESVRYNYKDIMIAYIDSTLQLQWSQMIHKNQSDTDNDNFLSFSLLNAGSQVHFFFLEKDRQRGVVSNYGLLPNGEFVKHPTLKSYDRGYEWMPRLSKQIAANQMIMPFVYSGRIGFARIDF